jgi:hypothetical protein
MFEPVSGGEMAYFNKRTGETTMVPDGIDPGRAYNPSKAGFAAIEEQAPAKIAARDGLAT